MARRFKTIATHPCRSFVRNLLLSIERDWAPCRQWGVGWAALSGASLDALITRPGVIHPEGGRRDVPIGIKQGRLCDIFPIGINSG